MATYVRRHGVGTRLRGHVMIAVFALAAAACSAAATPSPPVPTERNSSAVPAAARPIAPTRGTSTAADPPIGRPTTDEPTGSAVRYSKHADDLLLIVDSFGGYWAEDFELVDLPSVTLFGDGTMYRSGYPTLRPREGNFGYPNANQIPTITTTRLSPAQVDDLIDVARRLGLLDQPLSFGAGQITDIGSTRLRISLIGHTVTHSADAVSDRAEPTGPGRTAEHNAARKALRTFLARVDTLSKTNVQRYRPTAIIVNRMSPDTPYAKPAHFGPPDTQKWPIDTVPPAIRKGELRSCIVIDGDDVAPLLTALAHATVTTAWRTKSFTMPWVQFRPAFPGGSNGC